ncbi:MAG: S49 family peptidase, partial [Bacteroidota bacterium]
VLGSCLGSLIALFVIVIGFISVVAGSIGSAVEQKPEVRSNAILHLNLSQGVPELTGNTELTGFDPNQDELIGLHDLIRSIEYAAEDDNIKGIYLNNGSVPMAFTSVRLLREAILKFKESGKFVAAYSPYYTQGAYYLATAADEVYMGPLGVVDFRGLGAEIPHFKDMMDRIGVKARVFYAGDYKSATEPLRRNNISPENREQTKEFLEDIFGFMLADLAESRGLSIAEMRKAANEMTGWKEEAAVTAGLVDGILRRTEMEEKLHDKVGIDYDEKLNFVGTNDYFKARLNKLSGGGDEVAVLIAEGSIVDGIGDAGMIGDKKYIKELEKLIEDDDVKAVVLRVNSGGGSASSSENIWYAAEKLKESGKP